MLFRSSASVSVFVGYVNLNATEAQDTASFSALITAALSLAATEAPDNYAQNAYVLWLTPTQPDDPTIWVANDLPNDPSIWVAQDNPNDPSIWVPKNDPAPYNNTII